MQNIKLSLFNTHAPWIMPNEQHIMACTSTMQIVLGCKIPHELDALKWKAIGGGGGGVGGGGEEEEKKKTLSCKV
jgi:hypothetical protein